MRAFKGFDKDLRCRGFQYEIGKEYEENTASLCNSGFHACEYPLDCFSYYSLAESRFCEVELDATDERHSEDSKVCGKRIKIGAEIGIPGLVKAAIEYTKAHTTTEHTDPERATAGENGAATAGYKGAATAGNFGAATAGENGAATAGNFGAATAGNFGAATAGNKGAATAGNKGAATAGNFGAATAGENGAATAGYKGAATAGNFGAATAGENGAATARGKAATGKNGLSVARGNNVKVKGGIGAVLVIVEENSNNYDIKEWASAVVDGDKIKADTWYSLINGEFKEVESEENNNA